MSHEMRNPLNAMMQMHEVLDTYVTSDEGKKSLKVSKNSCAFLLV